MTDTELMDQQSEDVHAEGARRFPDSWFLANRKAQWAATLAGLDCTTVLAKRAVPLIVLRVLEAVEATSK